MLILPAIDLFEGKAVRLLRGDYNRMTVYSEDPAAVGADFASQGAQWIHLVDLEGARDGGTPNLSAVLRIREESGLRCEIGGGIRSEEQIRTYLEAGLDRVILGTAALENPSFLESAVNEFGDRIAVGADLKNGFVAVRGWTEVSSVDVFDFCRMLETVGVRTVICTDISRDGAMEGTNHSLYAELKERFSLRFIASGGVSSLSDVRRLSELGLYGAIIGKAYYTGAINLKEAVEVAK
ncbi:MAG: 1-(5-phosphoribosyl)-5-[(5-phosphoribosylamino)methylideneamino]imidazole-4-carboxamide isomerase [Clostridia bacterium]|nr:1-(5-phosphoribosyl)-5-[(5-phosphoribosylamino)methylideneamino]imidazole-4-carboxamide isomerase [Clostridia bacterium]MBQ4290160.1 1-(5-phosphoribosyl)-5-[(5-phosphoribosylamino)methylideneamino]imidazole-4-carboxamide isomerase [Clostridia bacterium]